jgi:hypothetical protein
MKHFLKIGSGIDVAPLNAQLEQQPELWGQYRWRKQLPSGPHSRMTDIWVRYNDIAPYIARDSMQGFNDEHDSVWYPAYEKLPALRDLIYPMMALVEGERLGGVLITRIPPGCGIDPHIDRGWHVEYYDKFYLSLQSAPGAVFACDGESINPKPGDLWKFDNRTPHWVKNESGQDRVTLIVCIRTRKWGSYNVRAREEVACTA